jgi:hypothetical protein
VSLAGGGAGGSAAVDNGTLAGLHCCTTVALICADGAGAVRAGAAESEGTRLAFQFAKDGILVGEQVADKTIAVALVHGQGILYARAKNARSKSLSQQSDVFFVGRGQINQAREMSHNGIKRSDVDETELSKGALQNLDSSVFRGLVSGGGVDRFHNFVNLGGNQGVYWV